MREITHLRTRFSKHFTTAEPGKYTAHISTEPLHYRAPSGDWDDLANLVKEVDGGWAASTSDVRFAIENGYLTISRGGKSITMRPTAIAMVDRTAPNTRWRKLGDADYTNVTRDGNTITVADIFPNTDLTVRITDETMSKQFVIRQRPNYPDPIALGWNPATTFLVIVWDVSKPAGATVRDTETLEVFGPGYAGNNDLVVEDNAGNPVVYFKKGEGWSSRTNAKKYPVWYVSLGAQVPFGEAFSYAKAAIATYPLTLDPTVVTQPVAANLGYVEGSTPGTGSIIVGNTQWSDKDLFGGASGVVGFARFDLTGVSGTVTDARITASAANALGGDPYQAGGGCYITKLNADWYPIDVSDASITGTQIASHPNPAVSSVFRNNNARAVAAYGSTIACSVGNSLYYTYNGGASWVQISAVEGELATNGSVFVLSNITTGQTLSASAGNLGSWTVRLTPVAVSGTVRLRYTNGAFYLTHQYSIAYSTATIKIARSTDGINWSVVYTGSARTSTLGGVLWNGSEYVQFYRNWTTDVSGCYAKIGVLTSSDGISWSVLTSDIGVTADVLNAPNAQCDAAVNDAGVYVVIASATSTANADFKTYYSSSLTSGWAFVRGTSGVQRDVVAVGSTFIGLPPNNTTGIKQSTTGGYWATVPGITAFPAYIAINVRPDTGEVIGLKSKNAVWSISDGGAWKYVTTAGWADVTSSVSGGAWLPIKFSAWTPDTYGSFFASKDPAMQIEYTTPSFGWDGPGPTADAVIRKTQTASITAAAVIRRTQTGSLTGDAVVRGTASNSLSAAATIVRQQSSTLTTDAILLATRTVGGGTPGWQYTQLGSANGGQPTGVSGQHIVGYYYDVDWNSIPCMWTTTAPGSPVAAGIPAGSATASLAAIHGSRVVGTLISPNRAALWDRDNLSADPVILGLPPSGIESNADDVYGDVIVGTASTAAVMSVAVWDAAAPTAAPTLLPVPSGYYFSEMPRVSATMVIGTLYDDAYTSYPVVWSLANLSADPVFLPRPWGTEEAHAIDGDWIVGRAYDMTGVVYGGDFVAVAWTTTNLSANPVWLDGSPSMGAQAVDGDLTGGRSQPIGGSHPTVWDLTDASPQAVPLPVPPGDSYGYAVGISGDIVVGYWASQPLFWTLGSGGPALDAVLRKTQTGALASDAAVLREQSSGITSDAWVVSTVAVSGDITADAVFHASQSAYALADAVISRPTTSVFAADAVIRATSTLQIGSDAIALRTSSATFTSDAELLLVVASTFSADAVKQKTQTGLLTANAVIRQTRTAGFPADALLLSAQTASVTADLAADAVVFWTQVRTATADASITKVVSGNIAATFAAATMSATPDAGTIATSSMAQTITATVFSQRAGGFTGDAVIV